VSAKGTDFLQMCSFFVAAGVNSINQSHVLNSSNVATGYNVDIDNVLVQS